MSQTNPASFLTVYKLVFNTNLGSTVFGGTDDHRKIHRRLDVIDLFGVFLRHLQNLPRLKNHTLKSLKSLTFVMVLKRVLPTKAAFIWSKIQ